MSSRVSPTDRGGADGLSHLAEDDGHPTQGLSGLNQKFKLNKLRSTVRDRLSKFDRDVDGVLNKEEMLAAVEELVEAEVKSRNLRWIAILAFSVAVFVIAANLAMSFAVLSLTKEAEVRDDNVWTSRATDEPVQTANTDFKISPDGVLVKRGSTGDDAAVSGEAVAVKVGSTETRVVDDQLVGIDGSTIATKQALQSVMLHVYMPDEVLDELRYVKVSSPTSGAKLTLAVLGWARIPSVNSPGGSYLKLITHPGAIRIDDIELSFDDVVGSLFQEAGFETDGARRRLQSINEIIGLFNSIPRRFWTLLDETERKPGFDEDAYMEFTTRYPCMRDFFKCMTGPTNATLLSMDSDGYVNLHTRAFRDTKLGASLEMLSNAEWPGVEIESFESKEVSSSAQWQDNNYYYCSVMERIEPRPAANGWNVTYAAKVAEEVLPDGSVQRQFQLQLGLDELSYSLITGDQEATGYNGTISITYWDDKATGRPYRILYSNGIEIIVTRYLPQSVDLSNWRSPACVDQSRNVSRMSVAPYLPNMDRRRAELSDGSDCGSEDCEEMPPHMEALLESEDAEINMGNSTGRRLLSRWTSCSPAGSCLGDSRTRRTSFDIKAVRLTMEYYRKGCGIKSVDFATACWPPLYCYGRCSGQLPWLCQSNRSFNCALGVRATVDDLIPSSWLKRAIDSVGELDGGVGIELAYSSYYNRLSANAYGSVSLITSNWYGTYGGRIRIQGWIDWYMSDDYFHANLVAEGKACLGFCMSSQWDLFDKAYYF